MVENLFVALVASSPTSFIQIAKSASHHLKDGDWISPLFITTIYHLDIRLVLVVYFAKLETPGIIKSTHFQNIFNEPEYSHHELTL